MCKSTEHTQDAICITASPFYAALQVYSNSPSGCICVLVWFLILKEAPQFGKGGKKEGYPYIIIMEDRWQRTVRSVKDKVHQTTATTSVRWNSLWFCLNDDHNFAAFAGIEVFPFPACGYTYKPYLQANLCFHNALHEILNRAKSPSFIPWVHFSTEALRMRCFPLAPVFLLQKNTAPAEATRAVPSTTPHGKVAGQRTTIGTLQNAI